MNSVQKRCARLSQEPIFVGGLAQSDNKSDYSPSHSRSTSKTQGGSLKHSRQTLYSSALHADHTCARLQCPAMCPNPVRRDVQPYVCWSVIPMRRSKSKRSSLLPVIIPCPPVSRKCRAFSITFGAPHICLENVSLTRVTTTRVTIDLFSGLRDGLDACFSVVAFSNLSKEARTLRTSPVYCQPCLYCKQFI
jgi:hypothetical protein